MTAKPQRFSEAELRLLERLKAFGYIPQIIYDIGASNGAWSQSVATICPESTYHLFEPLADHLDHYREVMTSNLAAHPNFTLHKIGLGDDNATLEMAIFGNAVGSTFIEIESIKGQQEALKSGGHLDEIASFPVRRLDDYAAEAGLPPPNLVKIDTQGYERTIIAGGKAMMVQADILILETWLYRGYGAATPLLHELIPIVAELGFVPTDFGDGYWDAGHKLTSIDVVFMREPFLDTIKAQTKDWSWRIWD